jgi:hypothetical protein
MVVGVSRAAAATTLGHLNEEDVTACAAGCQDELTISAALRRVMPVQSQRKRLSTLHLDRALRT